MTAFDDLTNDNSNDTESFIRIALQNYVDSGASDGPDTAQIFIKEFKKNKVQKLTPDIDDVNAKSAWWTWKRATCDSEPTSCKTSTGAAPRARTSTR